MDFSYVVKNTCKIFQQKFYDIFLTFAQNIDCGYTVELVKAVLTSTHNLCFGAKIRKIDIPLHTLNIRGYTFHGNVFLMVIYN